MTPRERFVAALDRRPISGLVPTFELVFFLTMEAFGRVHPSHRSYHQWDQMTEAERQLHRKDMADLFIKTAQEFEHSAIFLHPSPRGRLEEEIRLVDLVRDLTGDRYFLLLHGDATYSIPDGDTMVEFSFRMADCPEQVKDQADRRVDEALERARSLRDGTDLDGFALCSDYCFNTGPFMSPAQFSEFVTPYLKRLIAGYRELGFRTIKHTDGNIMPILDQLIETQPHALHSLDPQGGIDIARIKDLVGDRVCLIGNVNCGLIDTGTEAEYLESTRYALRSGMPGYGYVFSTSNCVYTGMDLTRYRKILEVWRKEGVYE